eukprot:Protomagalhaensia_sp_Gyna_25__2319@NODE_2277_length_1177_cov_79_159930_g1886_i0_p1_GENE_NODE_2277_length_1177_cov_79_159930_g1886_i0NODE_2277_length_1177_cov_79_159930_g1886_i0_p1_ORF_typecomplete_len232_score39_12DnaJ/PF00226_31/3_2e20DnaJ/PF00226_31/4_3e03ASD2/PF08687_11/0_00063RRF/PF01765_19/0_09AAA_lid_6/PF17866_1/4_1e03AAA_lid_6/PF17866_1/0_26_NODE_2277_length_1177_cov_79_159930_g1886_i083778
MAKKKQELYALLGLTKDCSTKDICKSYRILALKYHPDKQKPSQQDNKDTVTKFHAITGAYEILKDPQRRKTYDKTGSTEQSDGSYVNIEPEDIELFAKTYPGSAEEVSDLRELFERNIGDISSLYDYIPLSEPSEESLDRYLMVYKDLFEKGELTVNLAFEKAQRKLRKSLTRMVKNLRKERDEVKENGGSFDALVKAIEANRKRRIEEGPVYLAALGGPAPKRGPKKRRA